MTHLRNAAGNLLLTRGGATKQTLKLAGTGMAPFVPPTPGTPQPSATITRDTANPVQGQPMAFSVTMQNVATVYVALRKGGTQEGSRVAVSGFGAAQFTPASFGTDYNAVVWTASTGGTQLATAPTFSVATSTPAGGDKSPEGFAEVPGGWRLELEDDFDQVFQSYSEDGGLQGVNPTNWRNRNFGYGNAHVNDVGFSGYWDGGDSIEVIPSQSIMRMNMRRQSDDRYTMDGIMEPQWGEDFNDGNRRWFTWQSRARLRMSTNNAAGIGLYAALYPWHNRWSTEMDIVETPQNPKTRIDMTLHWGEGNGKDMGIYGRHGAAIITFHQQRDMSQWVTFDCRVNLYSGTGDVRMWVNGEKARNAEGQPGTDPWMWIGNYGINESMAYGHAGYAAAGDPNVDPNHPSAGVKHWYGYVQWDSPQRLDIDIDYHQWWVP